MLDTERLNRLVRTFRPDECDLVGPQVVHEIIESALNGVAPRFQRGAAPGEIDVGEFVTQVATVVAAGIAIAALLSARAEAKRAGQAAAAEAKRAEQAATAQAVVVREILEQLRETHEVLAGAFQEEELDRLVRWIQSE